MFIRFVISYTSKVASISGKFIAVKNVGDLYFQPLQNVPGSQVGCLIQLFTMY